MFSSVLLDRPAGVLADHAHPQQRLLGPRLGDVPALAHARAAVDRLELVAPDRTAEHLADEAGRARLPGDPAVLLELDHGVGGRVGDAALHRHAELVAELQATGAALGFVHRAGAVDLVMTAGIGEERKDRFRLGRDHALDGFGVTGLGHRDSVCILVRDGRWWAKMVVMVRWPLVGRDEESAPWRDGMAQRIDVQPLGCNDRRVAVRRARQGGHGPGPGRGER